MSVLNLSLRSNVKYFLLKKHRYFNKKTGIRQLRSIRIENEVQESDVSETGMGKYKLKSRGLVGSCVIAKPNPESSQATEDFFGIESDKNVKYIKESTEKVDPLTKFDFGPRKEKPITEKFISLPFGQARFDADNVVQFHGQYELLDNENSNGNQVNESFEMNNSGEKLDRYKESRHERGLRSPNMFGQGMIYEDPNKEILPTKSDYNYYLPKEESNDEINQNHMFENHPTEGMEFEKPRPTCSEGNMFDEQYFSTISNSEYNLPHRETEQASEHNKQRYRDECKEPDNYFDEQYFGDVGKISETKLVCEKGNTAVQPEMFDSQELQARSKAESGRSSFHSEQVEESIKNIGNRPKPNIFEDQYFSSINAKQETSSNLNTDYQIEEPALVLNSIFKTKVNYERKEMVMTDRHDLQRIPANVNPSLKETVPIEVNNHEANTFGTMKQKKKTIIQDNSVERFTPQTREYGPIKTDTTSDAHTGATTNSKLDQSEQRNLRAGIQQSTTDSGDTISRAARDNGRTGVKNFENTAHDVPNLKDPKTAFDFVIKSRLDEKNKKMNSKEEPRDWSQKKPISLNSDKLDSKGFRVLSDLVQDLSKVPIPDVLTILKHRVVYNENDIFAIDKPYGISCQGGENQKFTRCLTSFLPELAKFAHKDSKIDKPRLYFVHRLDRDCTGVLLFAKTKEMANTLSSMFAENKIVKKYWALTKDIPTLRHGTIDIPVCEGEVEGKNRMALHPDVPQEHRHLLPKAKDAKKAVTHYNTIEVRDDSALLEVQTETGLKHQIRVHLGIAIRCPILGDHKYSYLDKIVPQRLPDGLLRALNIRQSKARDVPLHLHAKTVILPEVLDGQNIFIQAPLPSHFIYSLKKLHYNSKFYTIK